MSQVFSRRGGFFYKGLLISIICITLGIVIILTLPTTDDKVSYFLGGLLVIMALYTIFACFKFTYKIKVDNKQITINNKTYSSSDIEEVKFSGKHTFPIVGKMEAVELIFKNGDTYHIFDDFYQNTPALKLQIENTWLGKTVLLSKQDDFLSENDKFFFYKGSILNFNLLLIISVFIFPFIVIIKHPHQETAPYTFIFPVFVIILMYRFFYYIGVGKHYLTIRNFAYFTREKYYKISEIREVLLETNYKAPHSITITMLDYEKKKYFATTLFDSHWRKLKKQLLEKGINVRDEIRLG